MLQSGEIFTLVDALKAIKDIKAQALEIEDGLEDAIEVRVTQVLDEEQIKIPQRL